MGWLTVRTSTPHGFAINRLAVQDFTLRTNDGNLWFCGDGHWAGVAGQLLLQGSDIHSPEHAPQG